METTVNLPNITQPPVSPLRMLTDSRKISFGEMSATQRDALNFALGKAEVGLCDYALQISIARDLPADFQLRDGQLVLHERVFARPALLRFHLRHAVELALWQKLCLPPLSSTQNLAITLLAAFAARRFYLLMLTAHRQQLASQLPEWLQTCVDLAETDSDDEALRRLATQLEALLTLQGESLSSTAPVEEALAIAAKYSGVAKPTEFILTLQGDERLLIDPATGLNKYGCSPRPRPEAITFSSCTASSVSQFAYCEAELLRHRLMATLADDTLIPRYDSELEQIRTGLRETLELDSLQTQVILSASGTDAELYPLVLFRSPEKKRLVNIIVAPDEVGSGTVLAAGGRHFSSMTPHGTKVRQGDAVADLDAESIEVVCVPIRKPDGANLTTEEVQQSVARAVADADKRADIILLHVVDNTKTGIVVPDVEFVVNLHAEYRRKLCVVVDACQFRLEKIHLHRYLKNGFCILITGSKFFTGPPFGGAFLIPPQFSIGGDGSPLPRGFADYFTRGEVPAALQSQAGHLSTVLNLGLLFRWTGALQEMRSFYSVPSRQRSAILRTFRNELSASIEQNPDLRLLKPVPPARWHNADLSLWDALPTIFSFAVKAPGANLRNQWLRISDLKIIYGLLNQDCAEKLPPAVTDAELQLAAQRCHIGQPVITGRSEEQGETGALRIACGARLVYGITYDPALGSTPAERFHRELTDARTVLAKVSLILKYWDAFNRPAA